MASLLEKRLNEILKSYNDYTNNPEKDVTAKVNYIDRQCACLSDIYKIVCLSSNDFLVEDAITPVSDKVAKKLEEMDELSPLDVICEEVKSWGISEDSFTYRIFYHITDVKECSTYKERIYKLSKILESKPNIISAAISRVAKNADFSNSKYIPILTKMPRKMITKELIVEQLLDFCYE